MNPPAPFFVTTNHHHHNNNSNHTNPYSNQPPPPPPMFAHNYQQSQQQQQHAMMPPPPSEFIPVHTQFSDSLHSYNNNSGYPLTPAAAYGAGGGDVASRSMNDSGVYTMMPQYHQQQQQYSSGGAGGGPLHQSHHNHHPASQSQHLNNYMSAQQQQQQQCSSNSNHHNAMMTTTSGASSVASSSLVPHLNLAVPQQQQFVKQHHHQPTVTTVPVSYPQPQPQYIPMHYQQQQHQHQANNLSSISTPQQYSQWTPLHHHEAHNHISNLDEGAHYVASHYSRPLPPPHSTSSTSLHPHPQYPLYALAAYASDQTPLSLGGGGQDNSVNTISQAMVSSTNTATTTSSLHEASGRSCSSVGISGMIASAALAGGLAMPALHPLSEMNSLEDPSAADVVALQQRLGRGGGRQLLSAESIEEWTLTQKQAEEFQREVAADRAAAALLHQARKDGGEGGMTMVAKKGVDPEEISFPSMLQHHHNHHPLHPATREVSTASNNNTTTKEKEHSHSTASSSSSHNNQNNNSNNNSQNKSKNVFVAGLSSEWNETTLFAFFSRYGPVVSVRHVGARRFGFVQFQNADDAEKAMRFGGRDAGVHVTRSMHDEAQEEEESSSTDSDSGDDEGHDPLAASGNNNNHHGASEGEKKAAVSRARLFLRGLPNWATVESLRRVCSTHGPVKDCSVLVTPRGHCKGSGFVQFHDVKVAKSIKRAKAKIEFEGWTQPVVAKYCETDEARQQRQARNKERKRILHHQRVASGQQQQQQPVPPQVMVPLLHNHPQQQQQQTVLVDPNTAALYLPTTPSHTTTLMGPPPQSIVHHHPHHLPPHPVTLGYSSSSLPTAYASQPQPLYMIPQSAPQQPQLVAQQPATTPHQPAAPIEIVVSPASGDLLFTYRQQSGVLPSSFQFTHGLLDSVLQAYGSGWQVAQLWRLEQRNPNNSNSSNVGQQCAVRLTNPSQHAMVEQAMRQGCIVKTGGEEGSVLAQLIA